MPIVGGPRTGLVSASAGGVIVPRSVGGNPAIGYRTVRPPRQSLFDFRDWTDVGGAYLEAVLVDNPRAYYRTGELKGPVAYDVTGRYNGVYIATPTLGVAAGTGDANTAVTLNGTTQYIDATCPVSIADTGKLSLEQWINITTDNGLTNTLVNHKGAASEDDYDLIWGSNGHFNFVVLTLTGSNRILSDPGIDLGAHVGAWHHVVVTADDSIDQIVYYVDGIAKFTDNTAWTGSSGVSTAPTHIGHSRNPAGNFFSGAIDDIAIYDSVLSITQVQAHYTAATGTLFGSDGFAYTGGGYYPEAA